MIRKAVGECLAECYKGSWSQARHYTKGQLVTSLGGLWLALEDIPLGTKPSTDEGKSAGWRLVAKGNGTPRSK
jgi:hypothetical protein